MSHDVGDAERCSFHSGQRTNLNRQRSHLFSRIRTLGNYLAISSIGSAFSASLSAVSQQHSSTPDDPFLNHDISSFEPARSSMVHDQNFQECSGPYRDFDPQNAVDTSTPVHMRSSSPSQPTRVLEFKRRFNNFSRSCRMDSHARQHSSDGIQLSPMDSNSHQRKRKSLMTYLGGDLLTTPPLTPDTFDENFLPSPVLSDESDAVSEWNVLPFEQLGVEDEEDDTNYDRSITHSFDIKEGKKPERSTCNDPQTDVFGTQHGVLNAEPALAEQCLSKTVPDDSDEWYGLEYTLELSSRERRTSDAQSSSAGEHSKSRESWAALHQGTIHPFFEDEDYYQWKNWHRYLDRQDERRKHRKGFEFKARSKILAWYYVDEIRTRDVMYWQREVYGVVTRDVKERLDMLAEHRPDPYIPVMRHNLGWYLKRSRSVSCLRQLRPLPTYNHNDDVVINTSSSSSVLDTDYSINEFSGSDTTDYSFFPA